MNYLPLGTVLGLVLFSEFLVAVGAWTFGSGVTAVRAVPLPEGVSNTEAIGRVLYTDYIFYFQTAGHDPARRHDRRHRADAQAPTRRQAPVDFAPGRAQPGVGLRAH